MFEMSRIQPKITRHIKKQKNLKSHGKRQLKDTKGDTRWQMLAFSGKDFKTAIIKMVQYIYYIYY